MTEIKVILADNQPLTAAGLAHILRERGDVRLVATLLDPKELPTLLEHHTPDLLIVDHDSQGYVTREDLVDVKKSSPSTNVLVISSDSNKASILNILQTGITGYLTKECSIDEIMTAVTNVARGEKFYCTKILDIIMEKHFSPDVKESSPNNLTARESEILTLLASGYSTQRVADQLHLSPHTVHTHRKSIIKKLNIKSPTEFVIYALDFGLIRPK